MGRKNRREPVPEATETRGGDRVDWAHAEPGHPLPELPPEKDALAPEVGYGLEDQ